MKLTKTFDVLTDTCEQVTAQVIRDENTECLLRISAWHDVGGNIGALYQNEYYPMEIDQAKMFLKAFNGVTAQDFVDRFNY